MNLQKCENILVPNLTNLPEAASQIIKLTAGHKIFLFYGDMGAGKTTLIKALCEAMGVAENVSSPTFSIVNEYVIPGGKIFHFDFYRLKSQTEALDMGYEEYFYSGEYCFIEWPQQIPDLLPAQFVRIDIIALADGQREITVRIV